MMMKKALIEEKWEDEDYIEESKPKRVVTNFVNGEWIDRIYGGGYVAAQRRLLQGEFGEEYKDKIEEKKFRRYRTDHMKTTGVYYQKYFHTSDGRWFDNSGMPCERPHHEPKQADIDDNEDDE